MGNAVHRRNFARLHLSVKLYLRVVLALSVAVFSDGSLEHLFVAEQFIELFVGAEAESTHKYACGDLAGAVYAYPKYAVGVLLEFKPRASVGHNGRLVSRGTRSVQRERAVNARASDQLADDDSFRTVDDKASVFGHEREITHENFFNGSFAGVVVNESYLYLERQSVSSVAVLALLDVVLGLSFQRESEELEFHSSGKVHDGRKVVEYFLNAFGNELLIGVLLQSDQIRNVESVFDRSKAQSFGIAVLNLVNVLRHYKPSLKFFRLKRAYIKTRKCPLPDISSFPSAGIKCYFLILHTNANIHYKENFQPCQRFFKK